MPFYQVILRAQKPQLDSNNRYHKDLSTLGNQIRKRRLELKFTAKEVGKRIGVDQDTIYGWEYHKTSPNPRRISEIIKFLGKAPDIRFRQFCGERILSYRKLHGISQAKLAIMLGIHKTNLQQWEKNHRCPSKEFLEKLSLIFNDTR